jgi:hypothetical protein
MTLCYPLLPVSSTPDFEVSAGLHAKTLHPGIGPVCGLCGVFTNEVGHAEVCPHRARWNTARHEQVKRAIASALSKIQGVTVVLEPLVGGTARQVKKFNAKLPFFPSRHAPQSLHGQPKDLSRWRISYTFIWRSLTYPLCHYVTGVRPLIAIPEP